MRGRNSSNASRRSSTIRRRSENLRFDEFGFVLTKRKDKKRHHRCHDYSYPQLSSVRVKELCELLSYWNGASFLCKSQIERFIRMGIPPSLRGRVWKCLLTIDSLRDTSDFNYQKCLLEVRGPLVDLGVSEYGILSAITTLSETQNDLGLNQQLPCCPELRYSADDITLFRQIALDLQRSFPTHRSLMGDSPEAIEGQAKLFRVLIAYAKYNSQLGEEEAFWAMTALLEKPKYLPQLFDLSLTKVQHQVKVFDQFLKHRKPKLSQHMKTKFPWVRCVDDIMFCEVCREYPSIADQNSKLYEGVTGSTRIETLQSHESSKYHLLCIKRKEVTEKGTGPMFVALKKQAENMDDQLKPMFNTAFYVAKQKLPFRSFVGLIELQEKNGIKMPTQYRNDKGCKAFVLAIAEVEKDGVSEDLKILRSDATKATDFVDIVEKGVDPIYRFYYGSGKRRMEVNAISAVIDEDPVYFSAPCGTRWMASRLRAYKAVIKNYNSVILHMEEASNRKTEEGAKCVGYLKVLKSAKFVDGLHFMVDVLEVLANVSLAFQSNYLFIYDGDVELCEARIKLEGLKHNRGDVYTAYMATCKDGKFDSKNNGHITYRNVPRSDAQLATYGDVQVMNMVTHFKSVLSEEEVTNIPRQWPALKARLKYRQRQPPKEVISDLLTENHPDVKDVLVYIMLTLSPSSAAVERLSAVFRTALTIMELLEPRLMELNDEGAVLPLLLRVPVDVAQYSVLVPALWNTEVQDWELKCINSLVLDESHHGPNAGTTHTHTLHTQSS
ncbi:hypothetical protein JOQ06_002199, partial [Pogonophryne albipinna]